MLRSLLVSALSLSMLISCGSDESTPPPAPSYPVLENDDTAAIDVSRGNYACYSMVTSLGNITIAIDEKYAPKTSANFKNYAVLGFYDDLIFHRVIKGFMIQGGGFDAGLNRPETGQPIEIESRNGLKNYRGRIAMARTSAPNSATSQFFINTVYNDFLNQPSAADGYGYTVFGGVIDGMDVVDAIESVATGSVGGMSDVPVEPVVINSVREASCS
ncbi:peptidylprolyl isomerase [Psychrosphaera aestuarii]|uniref:peptidylprolyl isomerase n=1 Tax=Psychrosphaera aestuarii TaxID=1266052 RepID=UPI001B343E4B|nr:peptidylprolyl isomerase [Psychrosphaera aestuarii]